MRPKTDLEARVTVITGAASGIGLALALRAAQEGMKVALADVDEWSLASALEQVKAKDVEAIAVPTDVSDADAVRVLARRTEAELGPPWLVCNTAGGDIHENLWGVIHGVQVFAPRMIERNAGHIVNTTYMFGTPGSAPHVATTHAIVGLSESLYRDLDLIASQVGVTLVCPSLETRTLMSATQHHDFGAPPVPDVPLDVPPPRELAELIFNAVTARRFWLFPRERQRHELSGRVPAVRTATAFTSRASDFPSWP
jgi:NAD(P)-dependent dehydrogenase (short-subunit alcohol dehydrogenase family)